jgi:hypothetical protein
MPHFTLPVPTRNEGPTQIERIRGRRSELLPSKKNETDDPEARQDNDEIGGVSLPLVCDRPPVGRMRVRAGRAPLPGRRVIGIAEPAHPAAVGADNPAVGSAVVHGGRRFRLSSMLMNLASFATQVEPSVQRELSTTPNSQCKGIREKLPAIGLREGQFRPSKEGEQSLVSKAKDCPFSRPQSVLVRPSTV